MDRIALLSEQLHCAKEKRENGDDRMDLDDGRGLQSGSSDMIGSFNRERHPSIGTARFNLHPTPDGTIRSQR
jgi:hypothetical protein